MPCPSRLSLMLHRRTDPQHFCSLNRLTFSKFVLRLAVVVFWTPQNILGTLFFLVAPVLEGTTKCNFLMLFCTFQKIRVALHNFLIMQSGMLSLSTKGSLVGCRNLVLVALDFCVDCFRVGSIPGPATVFATSFCYTELPCVQVSIWRVWLLCCVALLNTIALLC